MGERDDGKGIMQYFQYVKDEGYGVFICCEPGVVVKNFLLQNRFSEVLEKDFLAHKDQDPEHCRVLVINRATPRVRKYIQEASGDFFKERVTSKESCYLYRLQGYGLMVFSHFRTHWPLGVVGDFGDVRYQIAHRIILSRFLGSALASMGVCGFWGTSTEEGMVVMRKERSLGEAIFLDLSRQLIHTSEGVKPLDTGFSFLRLCSNHRENRKMVTEELLSFLAYHCVFLDSAGFSGSVKQMIYEISLSYQGRLHAPSHHPLSLGKQVAV